MVVSVPLLIADDHTGACDAASAFADQGWRVEVRFTVSPVSLKPDTVTAISMDVRRRDPDDALDRIRAWCDSLPRSALAGMFVKIDSTLAGGSAVFLEDLRRLLHFPRTIVAPANPAQGRLIAGGELIVHGEPSGIRLSEWLKSTQGVICMDAAVDADLDAVVAAAEPGDLLAGSGGLARALARRSPPPPAAQPYPPPVTGEILVINGSRQPLAVTQMEALRRASLESVVILPLDEPGSLRPGRLHSGVALIVTGGDTLAVVAESFGIEKVRLHGECVPGVALGSADSGVVLATKPGGFGTPATLIDTVRFLRGWK